MRGWKTWLAGIGMILGGAGMLASGVASGSYDTLPEGWAMITGGFAVIGIGHKIEKSTR